MKKSGEQIKEQLEFWFLKYYSKEKEDFNGKEQFTLFDLLEKGQQDILKQKLHLRNNEHPVLLLKVSDNRYLINTTERFVLVTENHIEEIEYTNFESHLGYFDFIVKERFLRKPVNVKKDGYYAEFGMKLKSGEQKTWTIPTGGPGFGFWNVTKRCELIGRKYLKPQ